MKHRQIKGIPKIINGICFGDVVDDPTAPLHRRLGIETFVHMQAVLFDTNGRWNNSPDRNTFAHWYRVPVTLAKVFV